MPTEQEKKTFFQYQKTLDKKSKQRVFPDTVWILLNSKEFIFHH